MAKPPFEKGQVLQNSRLSNRRESSYVRSMGRVPSSFFLFRLLIFFLPFSFLTSLYDLTDLRNLIGISRIFNDISKGGGGCSLLRNRAISYWIFGTVSHQKKKKRKIENTGRVLPHVNIVCRKFYQFSDQQQQKKKEREKVLKWEKGGKKKKETTVEPPRYGKEMENQFISPQDRSHRRNFLKTRVCLKMEDTRTWSSCQKPSPSSPPPSGLRKIHAENNLENGFARATPSSSKAEREANLRPRSRGVIPILAPSRRRLVQSR